MTLVTGMKSRLPACLKSRLKRADTDHMIISDEQARLAAQDLRVCRRASTHPHSEISDDLMKLFVAAVGEIPDTRMERVNAAVAHLDAGAHDPREVASKMISRIISDSLR